MAASVDPAGGWRADVLNFDLDARSQIYYHGEDYRLRSRNRVDVLHQLAFVAWAATRYDIFHFSNPGGIQFGSALAGVVRRRLREADEIRLRPRQLARDGTRPR